MHASHASHAKLHSGFCNLPAWSVPLQLEVAGSKPHMPTAHTRKPILLWHELLASFCFAYLTVCFAFACVASAISASSSARSKQQVECCKRLLHTHAGLSCFGMTCQCGLCMCLCKTGGRVKAVNAFCICMQACLAFA